MVTCTHGGRAEVVTRVRLHEAHRDLAARASAPRSTHTAPDGTVTQVEPLDDWTGGVIDDPEPHLAADGTRTGHKVRLRCPRPACRSTLELSPTNADWVVGKLLAGGVSSVELPDLVATLGSSSKLGRA